MSSYPATVTGYGRVVARLLSTTPDNVVDLAAHRRPSLPAIGYGVAAEHMLTSPAFKASMTFAA